MTDTAKWIASIAFTAVAVLAAIHGMAALQPDIPQDMPRGTSYFVQSGYNLQRNEPVGQWIACRPDLPQGGDLCRVTDSRGTVIYQGEFLPLSGNQPLPADQLRVAEMVAPRNLWVSGPAENGPVPIIPLANGRILVPAADSDALADRWARNPDELNLIQGQGHD
jgi:hypothetical protein